MQTRRDDARGAIFTAHRELHGLAHSPLQLRFPSVRPMPETAPQDAESAQRASEHPITPSPLFCDMLGSLNTPQN